MPDSQTNAVTEALNEQRAKLGLRTINTNWVLYDSKPGQNDWKIHGGGFLAKTVFKNDAANVSSEEDYYYSGAEFTDHEGHDWERITVHYDYGTKEVTLFYTGTNEATEAILAKYLMDKRFLMNIKEPLTNVPAVMATVRAVAAGWPDGPK